MKRVVALALLLAAAVADSKAKPSVDTADGRYGPRFGSPVKALGRAAHPATCGGGTDDLACYARPESPSRVYGYWGGQLIAIWLTGDEATQLCTQYRVTALRRVPGMGGCRGEGQRLKLLVNWDESDDSRWAVIAPGAMWTSVVPE